MAATPALSLEPRPARRAPLAAGAAVGLGACALLAIDLPSDLRLALGAGFALATLAAARVLRRHAAPPRIDWYGDGELRVAGRPARLDPATRVYAGLVVLVVRRPYRQAWWLARGALPAADFRRLKIRLRHGARLAR